MRHWRLAMFLDWDVRLQISLYASPPWWTTMLQATVTAGPDDVRVAHLTGLARFRGAQPACSPTSPPPRVCCYLPNFTLFAACLLASADFCGATEG